MILKSDWTISCGNPSSGEISVGMVNSNQHMRSSNIERQIPSRPDKMETVYVLDDSIQIDKMTLDILEFVEQKGSVLISRSNQVTYDTYFDTQNCDLYQSYSCLRVENKNDFGKFDSKTVLQLDSSIFECLSEEAKKYISWGAVKPVLRVTTKRTEYLWSQNGQNFTINVDNITYVGNNHRIITENLIQLTKSRSNLKIVADFVSYMLERGIPQNYELKYQRGFHKTYSILNNNLTETNKGEKLIRENKE